MIYRYAKDLYLLLWLCSSSEYLQLKTKISECERLENGFSKVIMVVDTEIKECQ